MKYTTDTKSKITTIQCDSVSLLNTHISMDNNSSAVPTQVFEVKTLNN